VKRFRRPLVRSRSGAFALAGLLVALLLAAGCAGPGSAASRLRRDEAEIRAGIASIREAILARDTAGILRVATADWRFTGPDGKVYDRAAYRVRTEALFARIERIESLDTQVGSVAVHGDRADVELTQTMVRRERATPGAGPARWWLRYRERHVWRRTPGGWRAQSVAFLAAPERKTLPP